MSTAKWKYIGFSGCDKKCIQSSLNNAANYVRHFSLRLHTSDCLCHVAMKRRLSYRDAEQVSIHRWFFIHGQVLVAINSLPVYGLTLEHSWNTIRRETKSQALRFKFQTSPAGAVLHTSPSSSWTQYCEPEVLNYGCDISVFFYAIK